MSKKTIRFAFLLAVAAAAVPATGHAGGPWETVRSEDGIDVSRKEIAGSPFVAFRGEGDVDAPILTVGSVLVDVPHEKEWIDSVVEAKILEEVSETEYIMYSHLGTPPGMSDRDFVTDVMLKRDPAQQRPLGDHALGHRRPGRPTRTSYVRAELQDSVFSP